MRELNPPRNWEWGQHQQRTVEDGTVRDNYVHEEDTAYLEDAFGRAPIVGTSLSIHHLITGTNKQRAG